MLEILKRFQQRVGEHCKPVIVADAAMLSTSNMQTLDEQGYRYIVGARLANSAKTFVDQIDAQLPRTDGAIQSHVLVCFMALMMGKYLEIKTGASIKQIRKQLWKVHEANLLNEITGKTH
jgi:transposase